VAEELGLSRGETLIAPGRTSTLETFSAVIGRRRPKPRPQS
jgi:hypothetical protein